MKRLLCLFLLGLCPFSSHSLFCQSPNATISGVVTDPAGKLLVGAEVAIINDATDVVYRADTNGGGIYSTSVLPPGNYHLQVSKQGFKTLIKPDIVLNVQSAVAFNFSLPLGATSESITVEAGGLSINTTDATVSTVIDRNFVENMPLNGRSLQDLLTLAPGVAQVPTTSGGGNVVGFSGEVVVNGQRAEANSYTVDGVSANNGTSPGQFGTGAGVSGNVPGVTALGSTQSMVSIDALQEFRSTTSTYSAEYGRTPGGNFAFSTRAGTNTLHGSAFDYFRNDALDANNWFNNYYGYPRGKERQNDFGGTLGGPLSIPRLYDGKNRSFYFFSYEGLRLRTPQAALLVFVPDNTTRANAPTALQPLLNAFPVANHGPDGLNDGFSYYLQAVSYPSSLDNASIRIDHSLGRRLSLFGRFADTPSSTVTYTAAVKNTISLESRTLTLGATYVASPHQSNELRFNRSPSDGTTAGTATSLGGATPLDLGALPGPGNSAFPRTGSELYALFSFASFTSFTLFQDPSHQVQYNVTDTHNWTLGRHTLKAGVDWREIVTTLTPYNPVEQVVFSSYAQLLANKPATATAKGGAPHPVKPEYKNVSVYLQDEWKISERLAASLGLRWDINPAPTDQTGPGPYTVTQITNLQTAVLAPLGTPLWKTDWAGIAPRLGLAYQLHPGSDHNAVLRLGTGLFYDMGNTEASLGYGGIGYATTQRFTTASFPLTSAQLNLPAPSIAAPYSSQVVGFDPNLKLPYSVQYSAALEQQLDRHSSFTLGYVGTGGRRLLSTFLTYPGLEGNANFAASTSLYVVQGRAGSSYNSLQAKYQRVMPHGLQILGSYTWSHSIDNASSNFLVYQLLRARSDFDIRHNAQAAITWQAPSLLALRGVWSVLADWGIDLRFQARTALPINIIGAQQIDTNTGTYTAFQPNLVAGAPVYLHGSYPGGRALNYAAFVAAPTGQQGDVPRNFAQGFGMAQLDAAVRRDIPLHEQLKLQFRAEAFNLANHPLFGEVYSSLSNGPLLFGRAYGTLNNSLGGGLNSLYQVGGPRSLQLMLKLSF